LLSPLLEPSLLFFLLSVRSLLGAVAVTPPKKKKKKRTGDNKKARTKTANDAPVAAVAGHGYLEV